MSYFRNDVSEEFYIEAKRITENDCFSLARKFIFAWISFNALYNEFSYDGEKNISDIHQIEKYNKKYIGEEKARNFFCDAYNQQYIEYFSQNEVRRMTKTEMYVNSDYSYDNMIILKDKDSKYTTRMEALLKILYQVRCNLLHGAKRLTNENNKKDFDIIKNAAPLLINILEMWGN